MLVYWWFSTTPAMNDKEKGFFARYLRVNASASAWVLQRAGYDDLTARGKALNSKRGSITVERGCDAIEPTALFVSAVLASPVRWAPKVIAVLVGSAILAVINFVRIISLFLAAVHWRAAFDILHLDVWQAVFIFLAIFLWAYWAAWAKRRPGASVRART